MPPKTSEDLFELFSQLQIKVTTYVHEPVFTTATAQFVNNKLPGAHSKNLFLKNKKSFYYLMTMLDDKRLDLKTFSKEMGCGTLSFASDDRLISHLGVKPGHVTPFALINTTPKDIKLILDKDLMSYALLNFHPLKNHMTTSILCQDFITFLKHLGFNPLIMTLPKLSL